MGTIPLPALGIRPPENPVNAISNALQVKGQLQQNQMGDIDLKMKQQQLRDQQTWMQAMQDPNNQGKTLDQILPTLYGKMSPQAVMGLQKAHLDMQKTATDLTDAQLKAHAAAHEQLQNVYNNAMQMDDASLQQNWGAVVQQVKAIPGLAADLDKSGVKLDPAQPLTKQQLQSFGPILGLQDAYLKNEAVKRQQQAELEKTNALTTEASSKSNLTDAQLQNLQQFGDMTPGIKGKVQELLTKQAQGIPLTLFEKAYLKGYVQEESKSTTTSDSLGISSTNVSRPAIPIFGGGGGATRGLPASPITSPTQTPNSLPASPITSTVTTPRLGIPPTANDPLNAIPNPNMRSLVKLIGEYREDPGQLSRLQLKHPEVMAYVRQFYPDWDQTDYNAKNKLLVNYTSGDGAKQINAINTAMGHVGVLGDAITALQNNDIRGLNAIANKFGLETGSTPVAVFKTIVHRVGPELTAAYVQGGGGEGERGTTQADFDPNLAPQTLKANVAITARLLRSKIGSLEQQYQQTVKRNDFDQRFITPEARASLDKYSPQSNKPSAGAGTGHIIRVNGKQYQYKGSGATDDLANYTEIK